METNKFATMLHRNTNKMTIILIYAFLEWILILLLLLNSLFSHLITKFALYFGLKPPCLWCSRCFGLGKSSTCYQDLVCEHHATEISHLGYCSKHNKLSRRRNMCKDCSCSDDIGESNIREKGEICLNCSCCDVSLSSDLYPPYLQLDVNGENEDHGLEKFDEGDCLHSPLRFQCKEIEIHEDDTTDGMEAIEKESIKVNAPDSPNEGKDVLRSLDDNMNGLFGSNLKLENWSNFDDHFLVTIESIDSLGLKKEKLSGQSGILEEYLGSESEVQKQLNSVEGVPSALKLEASVDVVEGKNDGVQELQFDIWEPELEYMNKSDTKNSITVSNKECSTESIHLPSDQLPPAQPTHVEPAASDFPLPPAQPTQVEPAASDFVTEDPNEIAGVEQPKTLVEREISDQELNAHHQSHAPISSSSCMEDNLNNYIEVGSTTTLNMFIAADDQSIKMTEVCLEETTMSVERIEEHIDSCLSNNSEVHDANEQHATQINHIEKKEPGIEEPVDGSFISETSSGEGVLTIEHLKSVLKEERKARCALYEELEEERGANAIASKQTMEMITRLQEEKATMQMEALQYQRMMDEQSEYDQEALQLLNELVVKVEKEKHELQMELEISRKKILHYEAKERRMMKRKSTSELSRTLSASFSNSEDSDQLPVDFDHESVDEDSCNGHPESSNHTPANGVINEEHIDLETSKHMSVLDESLADFEAEKLSILEKLKELEEKLFTLSDEEGEYYEDIKPVVLFPDEDIEVLNENEDSNNPEVTSNGINNEIWYKEDVNTTPHSNGFHLNTNDVESLNVVTNGELSVKQSSMSKFSEVNKRLKIEEEVDNVYERLQALEADREFLKQSISSLKKGDKGMDLLQEILQYLRDLRSVELSTRKMSDASLA